MKNIFLTLSLVLGSALSLLAQDCVTGYCPATLTAHHVAGNVAPVDADITYKVVPFEFSGTTMCWLAQNLGAINQASSYNVITSAYSIYAEDMSGWFWQFNRKRGYKFTCTGDPSTSTGLTAGSYYPVVTWITANPPDGNWLTTEDPCTLLLGGTWRIPTQQQWVDAESWNSPTAAYASIFKLHNAGSLYYNTGKLWRKKERGYYWSSTSSTVANAYHFYLSSISTVESSVIDNPKTNGFTLRCLRDL